MNHLEHNRAVVKFGTRVLTTKEGRLDEQILEDLVRQTMQVRKQIRETDIISSGAVAVGRAEYGVIKTDDEDADTKGMYASAGQPILINFYRKLLLKYGCIANQFLVTRENFLSSERSQTLLGRREKIYRNKKPGILILNENDTIADEELMFTDNDELTKFYTRLIRAPLVAILTDGDGVMEDLNDKGSLISRISLSQQKEKRRFVMPLSKQDSRGGMEKKYDYACELAQQGTTVHIANGRTPNILPRLFLDKEPVGTVFLPH